MSETPTEQVDVSQSILASTKKILGIDDSYVAFDLDILMHINGVFSILHDLGVGPENGLFVTDRETPWAALLLDDVQLHSVQNYVYLRVRRGFDPPQMPRLVQALDDQIKELEWRLNVRREGESWVDPNPVVIIEPPI